MSQSSNPRYTWHDNKRRYGEYRWNGFKWAFVRWMGQGWIPPQVQPQTQVLPKTPHQAVASGRDSEYGSSPIGPSSPRGSVLTYSTSQSQVPSSSKVSAGFAYAQAPYSHASSSSNITPFPKGQGATVKGRYSAEAGTHPGNLHYEQLDPSYYVRDRKFFAEGMVFSVIFTGGAGANAINSVTGYNECISEVRFSGNHVYTQARKFVVVKLRREFCFACPIFTYSDRATLKNGVNPEEHGIAYSADYKPELLYGESGIKKASIGVTMAPGAPRLHVASRIYYGIHHPIQYNVKVKDVGQVVPSHVPTLIGNWAAENHAASRQTVDATATGDDFDYPHFPEDSDEEAEDVSSKKRGKAPAQGTQNTMNSPPSHHDPHLYHPKKNKNGYDPKRNPDMYHPKHNPYGYHPDHNKYGFHPQKNNFSYHPKRNPYGYDPIRAPFCYHPDFSPFGFNAAKNTGGYHPQSAPFGFHPDANPIGYHPKHNQYGHHPKLNMYAYHPEHHPHGFQPKYYPNSYHPKWRPNGTYYAKPKHTPQQLDDDNWEGDEDDEEDEDDEDEREDDDDAEDEEDIEEELDDEDPDEEDYDNTNDKGDSAAPRPTSSDSIIGQMDAVLRPGSVGLDLGTETSYTTEPLLQPSQRNTALEGSQATPDTKREQSMALVDAIESKSSKLTANKLTTNRVEDQHEDKAKPDHTMDMLIAPPQGVEHEDSDDEDADVPVYGLMLNSRRKFDDAFGNGQKWAWRQDEPVARKVLKLSGRFNNWCESIGWVAPGSSSSPADVLTIDEKNTRTDVFLQLLTLHRPLLSNVVCTYLYDIVLRLEALEHSVIHDAADDNAESSEIETEVLLESLNNAVKCLCLQLKPIAAFAKTCPVMASSPSRIDAEEEVIDAEID